MDRPIVVNSLLCFIHNYRDTLMPNQLKTLVNNYFSKSTISLAHATLLDLLPPHLASNPPSDIIFLFDRITKSNHSPVFAAVDLNTLPLTLITDEDDSKTELLREIRQLKRFIQDALNGRVDEPTTQHNSPRVSPIEQSTLPLFSTPRPAKNANLSVSSPESLSSATLFNSPCSSVVTASPNNRTASPGLPYSRPIHHTSESHSMRKRHETSGNRLDAMVRKLADKQKEKEAAALESSPASVWPPQLVDPVAYMQMLRTMTSTITPQSSIFPSMTKSILGDSQLCSSSPPDVDH
ncbi:hypothetical protein AB6A40_004534 [Gnathostoma spinigerum]|uniref:Uncharacterized protein n=1 Tax=Gnathostoma spinigerum TaxID=75299 RepID=A0ABD6ECT0_9BILA